MYKFENFSKVKILVIGDVMVDRYLWGEVKRISPEAPVPVVNLKKTSRVAGGAANVAANIAGLGAIPYLIGVVGDDFEGKKIHKVLAEANISVDFLVELPGHQTTVKTRIVAHNQQIARIDRETDNSLSKNDYEKIWQRAEDLLDKIDVIVISDYDKGVLEKKLLKLLIREGRRKKKIILADPKGSDYNKYKDITLITPNKFEVAQVCNLKDTSDKSLHGAGQRLLTKLALNSLLITRGEEGMTLFEKGKKPLDLSANPRNVYDVTGAGDTVIATLAVAMGAGESLPKAAELANTAAGLVVEDIGTSIIKVNNLKKWVKERNKRIKTKTIIK